MLQYRRVPTLVPKSLLPTVTQEHLPGRKSDALRALESCQVTVDREIYSLKIRVSVVRLIQIDWLSILTPAGRTACVLIRFANRSAPGHHS
jgi:hypothetical protein